MAGTSWRTQLASTQPPMWNVSPGRVEPRFRRWWSNLVVCIPLWEAGGPPTELLSMTSANADEGGWNEAQWLAGHRGAAYDTEGSGDSIRFDPTGMSDLPSEECTALCLTQLNGTGSGNHTTVFGRCNDNQYHTWTIMIDVDPGPSFYPRYYVETSGGFEQNVDKTTEVPTNVPIWGLFQFQTSNILRVAYFSFPECELICDVSDNTIGAVTLGPYTVGDVNDRISFGRNIKGGGGIGVIPECAYVWDKYYEEEDLLPIMKEPYGIVTPARRLVRVAAGATIAASLSEGAKAGDTFADTLIGQVALSEGAKAGDTEAVIATLQAVLSEGAKAGDTKAPTLTGQVALSEGAKAGDTFADTLIGQVALSEGAKAGDTETGAVKVVAALTEGAKAGDTEAVIATLQAALSEGAKAGDTEAVIATLQAALSEGAKAGDTKTAIATLQSALTEGAKAGDTKTAIISVQAALTEGAKAGDTEAVLGILQAVLSEGAKAGDTFTVIGTLQTALTEGAKAGDTEAAIATLQTVLTEGAKAGDTEAAIVSIQAALSEGAKAGDTEAAIATLQAALSEGAKAGDTITVSVIYSGVITEGAKAGETVTAVVISGTPSAMFIVLQDLKRGYGAHPSARLGGLIQ